MQQTQIAVQPRKRNLQDLLLSKLRRSRMGATVFLINGFQIRGEIRGFDSFSRWCTSTPSPPWSPSGRCPGRRNLRCNPGPLRRGAPRPGKERILP